MQIEVKGLMKNQICRHFTLEFCSKNARRSMFHLSKSGHGVSDGSLHRLMHKSIWSSWSKSNHQKFLIYGHRIIIIG